jgi:hypothetical protein
MKLSAPLHGWILAALCQVLVVCASAQGTEKRVQKEDGNYTFHYFQGSDKVSTVWHLPKSGQHGYAVAYNQAGDEIYRAELSRMHMMRSVQFSYHPNGAVSRAHATWHPDGGIQSGGTTTTFDPQGHKTSEVEDIDPNELLTAPQLIKPTERPEVSPRPAPYQLPKPYRQEIVEEAPIYRTEYYIVNTTTKPLILKINDNQGRPLPADKFQPQAIAPGDTLKGGEFINAGHHGNPCDHVQFVVAARKPKWARDAKIDCKGATFREPTPTHRQYFFYIQKVKMPFY